MTHDHFNRKHLSLWILLTALLLTGCRGFHFGTATRLADAPAPTAIPLEAAAPEGADAILLPAGFQIDIFAESLRGPRMLALGPDGHLYVAERGADRILRLPDADSDGRADRLEVVAASLDNPSSLAFHPSGALYVAETGRVWRLSEPDAAGVYSQREVLIDGLPTSGTHRTRTLLFNPDGSELYVSVGSSCNVCDEDDARRAAIVRYDADGSGETLFAVGLRNAVGLAWQPGADRFWASNNGRDLLGDDLPPDTIHLIRENIDYGWPRCHAGRIVDPNMGETGSCDGIPAAEVELQAHSAPLGLTFYTGGLFPSEYEGDLFVAYHGSWNRREPTGYKIVRIPVQGDIAGPVEDFATGWLRPNGSNWGRPVDVITGPDGALYVSDDAGGRIYRIFYAP